MAQPVMVADLGAFATGAAVVVGDRATLLREPMTNAASWPGLGSDPIGAAQTEALSALRIEALRTVLSADSAVKSASSDALRAEGLSRLDRLTLVVPATQPDAERRQLIAAAELAGYTEVELLDGSAAAVLDSLATIGLPERCLALVCDLGQSWRVALVQVDGADVATIGWDACAGGRDLDALLLADFRQRAEEEFTARLTAGGELGRRTLRQADDLLRGLKHRLVDAAVAEAAPDGGTAPYQLSRDRVQRLAEPGLRWVMAACRSLLARAAAGVADAGPASHRPVEPGTTMAGVAAVVVVGGDARLPGVDTILAHGLGRPLVRPDDPELALVRGAARWVGTGRRRRVVADHSRWRVEPLTWPVPGGRARLERWTVAPGANYRRGAVLAQARTLDERVFDFTAPDDGVLLAAEDRVGDLIGPTLVVQTKRPASLLAGDPPDRRQVLSAAGEWLLTPDRELLVECAASARQVRLWSISDGVLVGEFQPDLGAGEPYRGRVFVNPVGRLALVAWNPAGAFSVFDVRSGRRTASFRDGSTPLNVLVNEGQWRLTAETEDAGSAGRYRRQVATVWDLGTGQRLEKHTDHVSQRLPGYRDRSAVDSFGENAVSPDGRLRAVPVPAGGGTGVALHEAHTDQEVYRVEHPPSARVRVAFSANGALLLANWDSGPHSQVGVWEL
jgi:molecular chaperone DnaK